MTRSASQLPCCQVFRRPDARPLFAFLRPVPGGPRARSRPCALPARTAAPGCRRRLVPRDPAHTVPGVEEPADLTGGQLRLGREDGVLAQARRPAAVRVARPRARHVQLPVHCRVPAHCRVDEVDRDLRVFDPAGSAGVLALDTGGVRPLCRDRGYAAGGVVGPGLPRAGARFYRPGTGGFSNQDTYTAPGPSRTAGTTPG